MRIFNTKQWLSAKLPHISQRKQTFGQAIEKVVTGKKVTFQYSHPAFEGLLLKIHYEIYDDLPLIAKYLTIENFSSRHIEINQVVNEVLGLVEEESAVVGSTEK